MRQQYRRPLPYPAQKRRRPSNSAARQTRLCCRALGPPGSETGLGSKRCHGFATNQKNKRKVSVSHIYHTSPYMYRTVGSLMGNGCYLTRIDCYLTKNLILGTGFVFFHRMRGETGTLPVKQDSTDRTIARPSFSGFLFQGRAVVTGHPCPRMVGRDQEFTRVGPSHVHHPPPLHGQRRTAQ